MRYLFRSPILSGAVSVFDAVGSVLFRWGRRPCAIPRSPRHVLLVRLDHIGDILFTTPIPRSLKESFNGCRVTVLTSPAGATLFENNPFVDEVLCYNAPWFQRPDPRGGKGASWLAVWRRLRSLNIDLALCPRGDLRENLLVWMSGIPCRLGYGVTGGGFFLSKMLTYDAKRHEREHTLELLREAGVRCSELRPALYFSDEDEKRFAARMVDWGLPRHQGLIGVQLQAGTPAKQWPRENALSFVRSCAGRFSEHCFVFVGDTRHGFEWLDDFLRTNQPLGWKNLMGRTTLRELFWLTRRFRFFVGHDSGPSHVAASYGLPTLFLYSGTNVFGSWRSLEDSAQFLRHPVECSPCHRRRCGVIGHPCMAQIGSEEALHWLEEKAYGTV